MKFNVQADSKFIKILRYLFLTLGICSLIVFLPAFRGFIISLAEKYMHRTLNHWLWNARMIKWEIQFFCSISIILLMMYFSFTNKSYKITTKSLNLFSWVYIVIISFVLIIIACQGKDIWYDETFSLGLARHSVRDLIILTANDVHPPLYYLILKIPMMFIPGSVTAAKIVSVIPVILIMCIANLFFSKEYSIKSAILFNLLFFSAYTTFEFAVEIRMYTWCMFFCVLCCISSYYIIKTETLKSYLLYVLFAECGAYCQYWTACGLAINFILISIICIFRNKKSIKKILISAIIGILLYIPWGKVVISQVSEVAGEYWIAPITFLDFIEYYLYEIPMFGIFKIIVIPFLIYFIIKSIKGYINHDNKSDYFIACAFTPILLIICTSIICIVFKPVYQAKYGLPLSLFTVFFIVLSINEFIISKNKKVLLIGVCLICIILNSTNMFLSERIHGKDNKAFTKMMDENLTENTVFMFDKEIHKHIPYCIAYTYPNNKIYNFDILELWTSAYFYDRKNLINDISNEKDLCLVLNEDSEPPEEFKEIEYIKGSINNYPSVKFYFKKSE